MEIPFTNDTKWMAVQYRTSTSSLFYAKGAPESIITQCVSTYISETESEPLKPSEVDRINIEAKVMARKGYRVLAFAIGTDLSELSFVGLIGLMDPPKPGISETITKLTESGIKTVMITGDSEETACTIAKELGILSADATDSVMSGQEIDAIGERGLAARITDVSVYYRTNPRHKMSIVNAWKEKGSVVAMTGDGVNDAPALKAAGRIFFSHILDIGISMGIGGTDVSKEAADIILVDDDLGIRFYLFCV